MASPSPSPSSAPTPQSAKNISLIAQDYEYNPLIPLRYWLRSAATLIREAHIYEREGQDEQVYLLLFRHAQLVLVHLSKHPDAKDENLRKSLADAEKEVKNSLKKLEVLKPRINKRYDRYTQLMRERQSRREQHGVKAAPLPQDQTLDPALPGAAKPLEADQNKELAVRLARKEINRRETVRRAVWKAGISPEEEHNRRTAGLWGDWESALEDSQEADNDLSKRIREVKVNIDHTSDRRQNDTGPVMRPPEAISSTSAYKYPTVPRLKPLEPVPPPSERNAQPAITRPLDPPTIPPKEQLEASPLLPMEVPPPRPSKLSPAPALPDKVPSAGDKGPSPDLDPSSFTFKPSAYLENGTPLRTVFLPPELRMQFVELAASNTRRNLETCGILCGTLISNALFISRLLIPEQSSTSDTCETVNESAIFDYCDSEDLIVLGWIHTHPTQTCFMSSRDLHTHCGYQVMLPESIAIVCSPSKSPDWGIFRLTDPPGLKTVLNCTQTGLFHPHSEYNIYTEALRPGHVFEAKGLEFDTVDQRPAGSQS